MKERVKTKPQILAQQVLALLTPEFIKQCESLIGEKGEIHRTVRPSKFSGYVINYGIENESIHVTIRFGNVFRTNKIALYATGDCVADCVTNLKSRIEYYLTEAFRKADKLIRSAGKLIYDSESIELSHDTLSAINMTPLSAKEFALTESEHFCATFSFDDDGCNVSFLSYQAKNNFDHINQAFMSWVSFVYAIEEALSTAELSIVQSH